MQYLIAGEFEKTQDMLGKYICMYEQLYIGDSGQLPEMRISNLVSITELHTYVHRHEGA